VELTHRFTVPTDIDRTWAAFDDIESVAGCFPGAVVTEVDGADFKGTCKVRLGPIALVYNGTGTFLEKDEAAKKFVVDARGKDKRGNGTAAALVTATLSEAGTSTQVDVLTDLAITGKPAQFGRGMIEDISNKLLGQFVSCLEQRVDDGSPGTAPAASAGAAVDAAAAASEPVAGSLRSAPSARSQEHAPPPARPQEQDDALDLGATVLPILARAYWKQALAGLSLVAAVTVVRRWLHRH